MYNFSQVYSYLKKLFYAFQNNRLQIFFLFFFFLLISLLDLIGLSLLPIFFSEIFSFSDELNYIPFNIDIYFNNKFLIYFLFIALILRTIIAIFSNYLIISIVNIKANHIRVKLFYSYFNIQSFYNSKKKLSDKILNIEKYVDDYMVSLNSLFRILNDLVISLVILIFLFFQNFYVTFFSTIFFALLLLVYFKFFIKRNIKYGIKKNISLSKLITLTKNVFENINEVKSYFLKKYFTSIFSNHSLSIKSLNIKSTMITTSPKYIFESIFLFSLILMFITFIILNIDLKTFFPFLIMVLYAATKIIPMINQFVASLSNILNRSNSLDLIYKELILSNENKFDDELSENFDYDEIILRNINYENSDGIIFNNAQFSFKKNQVIGLFGPSGSGKTTLIDILLGYVKLDKIDFIITKDNHEVSINDINNISSFTSNNSLFVNSTIFENITFSKIDKFKLEKVNSIMEIVEFRNYVDNLPNKLLDIIDEDAKNYSEGQKQRIAVARSLFFNKKIIIFDEALSLLDEISQKNIIKNIKKNLTDQTLIIISHNLELQKYCDVNYEIKNKKIIT